MPYASKAKRRAAYKRTAVDRRGKRRAYYLKNAEKIKAGSRAYRSANAELVRARQRKTAAEVSKDPIRAGERRRKWKEWRDKNKPRVLAAFRKWKGMPEPTRECPEVCELCGSPPRYHALALDHCHLTGKFRGWLCSACNLALGTLGDTLAALQRAVDYLKRAEGV